MRKSKLLGILAAVLLALVAMAGPASANHSWGGYHWARTANPFTLQLGNNTTGAWSTTYLPVASGDWFQSTVLDTTITSGAANPSCGPVSGRVEVCNGTYGSNGWLGIATIWISGSHIMQGTVKVNDTYFNTSTYNDPNAKQHVMCQEVGHTLGLNHQKSKFASSCMNNRFGLFDPAFAHPNQHDYDELVIIYSHTDSFSTVAKAAATAKAGASGDDDSAVPAGAGPQHGNVFARDLGGGRMLVTFVVWAGHGNN